MQTSYGQHTSLDWDGVLNVGVLPGVHLLLHALGHDLERSGLPVNTGVSATVLPEFDLCVTGTPAGCYGAVSLLGPLTDPLKS